MSEENPKKSYNVSISKVMLWQIVAGILFILLLISTISGGFSIGSGTGSGSGSGGTGTGGAVLDVEDLIDDDAFKGDANAPVTIIEWSDYECPFCGRFYRDTLGLIESAYIDTGKVKFVYRDFPLSFHPNAQKAAEAAECAGEQGKYFDMHDLLFENGVSGG